MMRHRYAAITALVITVAVVVAIKFAMVDVRAQVDDAVSVGPADFDFGIAIMEARYEAACDPDADPAGASGNCMSIHLSDSFLDQTQFVDVEYSVFCEDKAVGDAHRADANITPFIILRDSDPADGNDALDNPNGPGNGCGVVAYAAGPPNSVQWARGQLDKRFDLADLWDMSFTAPLCSDNYNPETDPLQPADQPGGGLIDPKFCHKGPGGGPGLVDSDEYTDLASNVRFEVTSFSTPTPTPSGTPTSTPTPTPSGTPTGTPTPTPTPTPSGTPTGTPTPTPTPSPTTTPTPTGTAFPFTSTPKPTASPSPTPSSTTLAITATPKAFPQTGGGDSSAGGSGLWIMLAGAVILTLALAVHAGRTRRGAMLT